MLVLDFKVDYRLKNTQRLFVWNALGNTWYVLTRMQRKKETFCTGVGPL